MRTSNPAIMFAYVAGRNAARRDEAMQSARQHQNNKRLAQTYVKVARSFHQSFLLFSKLAKAEA